MMQRQPTFNPMTTADVNSTTPYAVVHTFKRSYAFDRYRPTSAYVSALKLCGCEGPHLGHVETVLLSKVKVLNGYNVPRDFNPEARGYELKLETKDRVALYLNGERVYGMRWYRGRPPWDERVTKSWEYLYQQQAWRHHYHTQEEAQRPRNPDGRMHKTAADAMTRRPRAMCKLWAVYPDKPHRYDRRPKPVGYVWGKDAAALALRDWWVRKNNAQPQRSLQETWAVEA